MSPSDPEAHTCGRSPNLSAYGDFASVCVFFLLSANSTVPQTRLESLFSAISSDIFFSISGNSTIQEIEGSFHSFITEVYYQLATI